MTENSSEAFSMPMFRQFVPERLRFWMVLFFPVVFQFSDGIYMSLSAELMGSLSLMRNDVMMCGYSSIIGLTMAFPILFRLKFRFTTRQILLATSLGLVACNLLLQHCRFMPLMVLVCFLVGMLKLWGTFECMSSVMRGLTPKMDFAAFLTVVFLLVFGSIQLSGIAGAYLAHQFSWRFMNLLAMGLELSVALLAAVSMRDFRPAEPVSLRGIDWLGLVLWAVFLISVSFVAVYGEWLDWLASPQLRGAVGIALLALAASLWRMAHLPNAYLEFAAFKYRNLWSVIVAAQAG